MARGWKTFKLYFPRLKQHFILEVLTKFVFVFYQFQSVLAIWADICGYNLY